MLELNIPVTLHIPLNISLSKQIHKNIYESQLHDILYYVQGLETSI